MIHSNSKYVRLIKNGFNIYNLLRLHFRDSKHLRGFVCHERFWNFLVIRNFLPPPPRPQLYMLAAALPTWLDITTLKSLSVGANSYTGYFPIW